MVMPGIFSSSDPRFVPVLPYEQGKRDSGPGLISGKSGPIKGPGAPCPFETGDLPSRSRAFRIPASLALQRLAGPPPGTRRLRTRHGAARPIRYDATQGDSHVIAASHDILGPPAGRDSRRCCPGLPDEQALARLRRRRRAGDRTNLSRRGADGRRGAFDLGRRPVRRRDLPVIRPLRQGRSR